MRDAKQVAFVGVDIESTGKDVLNDSMLELGMITFDKNLNEIDCFSSVIYPSVNARCLTNEYVTRMHTRNGLFDDIEARDKNEILTQVVEAKALSWLNSQNISEPAIMLGSSVHFDRMFIKREMPNLDARFSYKLADATSFGLISQIVGRVSSSYVSAGPTYDGTNKRVLEHIRESANKIKRTLYGLGLKKQDFLD